MNAMIAANAGNCNVERLESAVQRSRRCGRSRRRRLRNYALDLPDLFDLAVTSLRSTNNLHQVPRRLPGSTCAATMAACPTTRDSSPRVERPADVCVELHPTRGVDRTSTCGAPTRRVLRPLASAVVVRRCFRSGLVSSPVVRVQPSTMRSARGRPTRSRRQLRPGRGGPDSTPRFSRCRTLRTPPSLSHRHVEYSHSIVQHFTGFWAP